MKIPSTTLIIFGASGDLAKLKLFPAIKELKAQNRLPAEFQIIGFARSPKPKTQNIDYIQGDYTNLEDFKKLKAQIKHKHILSYFAVPPNIFQPIVQNLAEAKIKTKLILEKPFGENAKTSKELFHFISKYFYEKDIYLLDHYLGKNAVKSLLHLRHENRILNLMMKGAEIANIQISALETIGIEERGGYFDQVGALKDMLQSHLLQILALITMSIPITEDEHSLHQEKENILSSLKFEASQKNLTLGQYASYTKEKNIPKNSKTETFVAAKLFINRESWYQVPIYIRTGKKLSTRKTYITIELKKFPFQDKKTEPNRLIFILQPDEEIQIHLTGQEKIQHTKTSLSCEGDRCLSEYSFLIREALRSRKKYFLTINEIIAAWEITDQILSLMKKIKTAKYPDGSLGPKNNFPWYEL